MIFGNSYGNDAGIGKGNAMSVSENQSISGKNTRISDKKDTVLGILAKERETKSKPSDYLDIDEVENKIKAKYKERDEDGKNTNSR